jgi:hypothetical protein
MMAPNGRDGDAVSQAPRRRAMLLAPCREKRAPFMAICAGMNAQKPQPGMFLTEVQIRFQEL